MGQTETPSREQIMERIRVALVEFGVESDDLRPEASLEELDIDSLDLFELGQILHQDFGIEVEAQDFDEVETLGQAQDAMLRHLK
jgi:acyl carrier protein